MNRDPSRNARFAGRLPDGVLQVRDVSFTPEAADLLNRVVGSGVQFPLPVRDLILGANGDTQILAGSLEEWNRDPSQNLAKFVGALPDGVLHIGEASFTPEAADILMDVGSTTHGDFDQLPLPIRKLISEADGDAETLAGTLSDWNRDRNRDSIGLAGQLPDGILYVRYEMPLRYNRWQRATNGVHHGIVRVRGAVARGADLALHAANPALPQEIGAGALIRAWTAQARVRFIDGADFLAHVANPGLPRDVSSGLVMRAWTARTHDRFANGANRARRFADNVQTKAVSAGHAAAKGTNLVIHAISPGLPQEVDAVLMTRTWTVEASVRFANWINPWARPGMEPGPARAFVQDFGHVVKYYMRRGGSAAAGAAFLGYVWSQVRLGHYQVYANESLAVRPFNGPRNSHSIAIKVPGALIGAWYAGPHYRLPYPVDLDSGVMPVARFGPPPGNPQGPKSVNVTFGGRYVPGEAGIGFQFGHNDFGLTKSFIVRPGAWSAICGVTRRPKEAGQGAFRRCSRGPSHSSRRPLPPTRVPSV